MLNETELDKELLTAIDAELDRQFDDVNTTRFAVRSSAVGEDGSELSSAGQLESILDVSREQAGSLCIASSDFQVATCVRQCWASNFRREAIAYRR
jgi:pyruvate,water dikinase